ncbi:MAG: hypothetical protein Q7R96_03570 [Nanoarchaeota archaeon]|nr:hypothetical protein [Nanoarchaeota archaeon]
MTETEHKNLYWHWDYSDKILHGVINHGSLALAALSGILAGQSFPNKEPESTLGSLGGMGSIYLCYIIDKFLPKTDAEKEAEKERYWYRVKTGLRNTTTFFSSAAVSIGLLHANANEAPYVYTIAGVIAAIAIPLHLSGRKIIKNLESKININ